MHIQACYTSKLYGHENTLKIPMKRKFSWVVTEVAVKHTSISNEIRFHRPWKPCEKYFSWSFHTFS